MPNAIPMGEPWSFNYPHPLRMWHISLPQFHWCTNTPEGTWREKEKNLEGTEGGSDSCTYDTGVHTGCWGFQQQKLAGWYSHQEERVRSPTLSFRLMRVNSAICKFHVLYHRALNTPPTTLCCEVTKHTGPWINTGYSHSYNCPRQCWLLL